ncbi:centrosomal protein of 164 kDa [Amia ocellicauda]|uniref:centrosomal protein of 164 kDa n=1 Tax=Amia ocellicauda TaxID=2972642 RepID=UPI0034643264
MSAATLQIGDQLILEEDCDENYIPTEQEIQEYAREIGIDPDKEPELMWLAREGIVAPLPSDWKPCQDVTGEVYYFNFSTGQSTWDHPCDEQYRCLVAQERERSQPRCPPAKKDKKKKKEKKDKKDKKEKEPLRPPMQIKSSLRQLYPSNQMIERQSQKREQVISALGPLQTPLGSWAPLRGLADVPSSSSLRVSAGSLGGLEPLKTALGAPDSRLGSSLLGAHQEERVSLSLPGFEDEDVGLSEAESSCGTAHLLHNLHLELDSLEGGLQYEDSEASKSPPPEERTEPELQDLLLSPEPSHDPPSQVSEDSDILEGPSLHSAGIAQGLTGLRARTSEHVLDVVDLSPALEDTKTQIHFVAAGQEEGSLEEKEERKSTEASERQIKESGRGESRPRSPGSEALSGSERRPEVEGGSGSLGRRPETERGRAEPTGKGESGPICESGPWPGGCAGPRPYLKDLQQETERQLEEERARALQERQERLRDLAEELRREEKKEEQRLRQENTDRIRALRERLQGEREAQEARLRQEHQERLEAITLSIQTERNAREHHLREESEAALQDLRAALESERTVEVKALEEKRQQDLESLKLEVEDELRQERQRLEAHREAELEDLRREGRSNQRQAKLGRSQQTGQQLTAYQRELGEVLREVREEVQKEHDRKLEQLREDHLHALESIRESLLEEEQRQRDRLLSSLQEEKERVQAGHQSQLKGLRTQLDAQLNELRRTHSHKESKIQELAEELERRAKEMKARNVALQTQEEDLRRRREQLEEEEEQREKGLDEADRVQVARDHLMQDRDRLMEEMEELTEESERLWDERNRLREEREKLKKERDGLQEQVTQLQECCDKLSRRASDVERLPSHKEPLAGQEDTLQLEDLETSPLHPSVHDSINQDSDHERDLNISMDNVRQYISSEGLSLQRARRFLERQSGSLTQRQAALQAAHSSWCQDPGQDLHSNIQQEASHLEQLKTTVKRGQALLRRKEQRLSQLESSLTEELSDEDAVKGMADKKVVTFDFSDSDISSINVPKTAGLRTPGPLPAVPAKVHHLTDSLQQISMQLNTVLEVLGSQQSQLIKVPAQRQAPITPFSVYTPLSMPLSRGHHTPSLTPWAWRPHPSSCALEDTLGGHWHNFLPGATEESVPHPSSGSHLGYNSAREQVCSLRSGQTSTVELDGQRLQGLIDGNKRWLERRRKDPKVPLFTNTWNPPSMSGLVQLGLDDNNQIKVYHY